MKKAFYSLSVVILSLLTTVAYAQVTDVRYIIKYNKSTCMYDVKLIVQAGSALTSAQRISSTGQVTLVVPSGSNVGNNGGYATLALGTQPTVTSVNPRAGLLLNAVPSPWQFGNTNKYYYDTASATNPLYNPSAGVPASMGAVDVYSFKPNTSLTFWPVLSTGDTLTMFSLSIITPTATCGAGVRLWNNNLISNGTGNVAQGGANSAGCGGTGVDPCSGDFPAGGGQQYNNGMGIGSSAQIYRGNGISNTTQSGPSITSVIPTCSATTSTLTATVLPTCGNAITSYSFRNPSNAIVSTTNSVTITNNSSNTGTYTLTVTSSNGCTSTVATSVNTIGCFILPIKIVKFGGVANKCTAQLDWQVSTSDKDFQRFEVQYSRDGAQYTTVGEIARNPYNDKYTFGYDQVSGKGLYRLKVIDLQGKSYYSETVSVYTSCDANEITISPNPTTSVSTVNGVVGGDQIKVTDMLGNVLANYISGGNKATIEVGNLPAGVYSVMISRNGEIIKAAKLTKL